MGVGGGGGEGMSSSSSGKKSAAALQKDMPWRASSSGTPRPKIHQSPILCLSQSPDTRYAALAIMKHPDPIGARFATEARLEAAGPDCVVPGQITPIRLLGLQVWPIDVNMKFMNLLDGNLGPLESLGHQFAERRGLQALLMGKTYVIG